MSLDNIVGKQLYFNVRTKKIVAVLDKDSREANIATVNDGSLGRRRTVRASLIHSEYLASDGQPQDNGYVPLAALPEDHPHAVKAPENNWSGMNPDDIDNLDDAALAVFILEQERIKKEAADLVERAKAVAKYRRGGNLGIDIQDGVALVYTSGTKFDAPTAKRNLSAEDYKRILLPKPDATMARKLFEHEPDKLDACLKDNGPTLTVRRATDEDKAKYLASRPSGDDDEDFSFEG